MYLRFLALVTAMMLLTPQAHAKRDQAFWSMVRKAQRALARGESDRASKILGEANEQQQNEAVYLHVRVLVSIEKKSYQAAIEDLARLEAKAASSKKARVRILFLRADILERIPGRLGDAREAWRTLLTFAKANESLLNPRIPQERIAAIDHASEQEYAYREVRKKIRTNRNKSKQ